MKGVLMESNKDWHKVLPKRVMEAREAAGLTLSEAASLLEFRNYQTLSSIEKGTRRITAHELSIMADVYGRALSYFFEPEVSPDPTPLWRKKPEASVTQIKRRFLSYLENYSNLEKSLELTRRWKDIQKNYTKADFQERHFQLVQQIGSDIRNSLDLGAKPALNLRNALENVLRVKVLHLPLPDGVSGASVVDNTLGVGILINANDAPWRRNFDLAHELFHIVTWNVFSRKEVGDGITKTKPEQYADAFASSLLLPKEPLLNSLQEVRIGNQIKLVDIIELAKEYDVSTAAILWRLVNLGQILQREVNRILDDPRLSQIDRLLRQGLSSTDEPSKFPERYIFLACRCLLEGKISRGTFADYLEIDRSEVDDFLKRQGFLEETHEEIATA
jgi:Zn-dependent peptidase ImmA (M78 family)